MVCRKLSQSRSRRSAKAYAVAPELLRLSSYALVIDESLLLFTLKVTTLRAKVRSEVTGYRL